MRGSFHHSPAEVDEALALLAAGEVDWRAFAGPAIGLGRLRERACGAQRGPGPQDRGRAGPGLTPDLSRRSYLHSA